MKKFKANGSQIKKLRMESERLSTQKEFSHALGISERKLRKIENEDDLVPRDIAERLGKLLNTPWQSLISLIEGASSAGSKRIPAAVTKMAADDILHIPRYDEEIASVVRDAVKLYEDTRSSRVVVSKIQTSLTSETESYADELLNILNGIVDKRHMEPAGREEIALQRRIRELLVLLKGSDVWIYTTLHWKRLPESNCPVANWDAGCELQIIVAFGPPGEYGEETVRVPVDNGHPFSISRTSLI